MKIGKERIDIKSCKCRRNFKPSIERLIQHQQDKTTEYYKFVARYNQQN